MYTNSGLYIDNSELGFAQVHEPPRRFSNLKFAGLIFLELLLIVVLTITESNLKAKAMIIKGDEAPTQLAAEPKVTVPAQYTLPVNDNPQIPVGLQALLEEWVAKHPGKNWSVSVKSLADDDETVTAGNGGYYFAASLYKPLLLLAMHDKYSDTQISQLNANGQTLGECTDKMLRLSDNPCGEAVADLIGWKSILTSLSEKSYDGVSTKFENGVHVTPDTMVNYMADLYQGKLLSKQDTKAVLNILAAQKFRSGIPTACSDCAVYNKTGDNGVRHDVGIVEYAGGAYVVGIFSDSGSYAEISELSKLIHENMTAAM